MSSYSAESRPLRGGSFEDDAVRLTAGGPVTRMTRLARVRELLEREPERWWLARDVAEACGVGVSADASAVLGEMRRRGLVESREARSRVFEWRWARPEADA